MKLILTSLDLVSCYVIEEKGWAKYNYSRSLLYLRTCPRRACTVAKLER